MIKTSEFLEQDEGVQLWRTTSTTTPFFIRSLRTRETWETSTEVKAAEIYALEVARSRACPVVQKKLGAF
jgi:aspartate carbamoyltransferase catalytic subunit